MVPCSRRRFLTATTLALPVSGCISPDVFRETERPSEDSIRITTGDLTPEQPLGTENPDYNLAIRNARDERVSGTLSIGPTADGPTEQEFDLPAGEREVFAVLFPEAGRYTVSVALDDGSEESFEWAVNNPDPDEILSIAVEEDGIRFVRESA